MHKRMAKKFAIGLLSLDSSKDIGPLVENENLIMNMNMIIYVESSLDERHYCLGK